MHPGWDTWRVTPPCMLPTFHHGGWLLPLYIYWGSIPSPGAMLAGQVRAASSSWLCEASPVRRQGTASNVKARNKQCEGKLKMQLEWARRSWREQWWTGGQLDRRPSYCVCEEMVDWAQPLTNWHRSSLQGLCSLPADLLHLTSRLRLEVRCEGDCDASVPTSACSRLHLLLLLCLLP